jgi:hypothetical protein
MIIDASERATKENKEEERRENEKSLINCQISPPFPFWGGLGIEGPVHTTIMGYGHRWEL